MASHEQSASPRQRLSLFSVLGNLGWPILLGLAVTSVFFILIYRGPLNVPVMHRYFASHPVTFAETALFFIGLASLGLKLIEILGQYVYLGRVRLEAAPQGGQPPEDAPRLMAELEQLDSGARRSQLVSRLRDALEFVRRTGSAEHLHDELKYLADVDAAKQQDAYSLVRIVIWATPMLGFLGTVMGITQALGDLSANSNLLATAIDKAIQGLLGGLYVAFDTTALALTLSMVLMFIQFILDRAEMQFLGEVDARAGAELVGRFHTTSFSSDPQVATVERMAHAVVRSTEQLVKRQAELWQESLGTAQLEWNALFAATGSQVRQAVDGALDHSLDEHSARLVQAEQTVLAQAQAGWERIHAELSQQTERTYAQQSELTRHSEVLLEVLRATGDVVRLEQALNSNLASLAGSRNFEDTVMSLSAAIHLLTTRLGRSTDLPPVELPRMESPVAGKIRPATPSENVSFASSWVDSDVPVAPSKTNARQGKAA